jgi:hypothetical protein
MWSAAAVGRGVQREYRRRPPGDAITFDTTYKINLYEMPFGLFVGVNNHFQSVLLAGVLLTDETIETFRWVFREFAKNRLQS